MLMKVSDRHQKTRMNMAMENDLKHRQTNTAH